MNPSIFLFYTLKNPEFLRMNGKHGFILLSVLSNPQNYNLALEVIFSIRIRHEFIFGTRIIYLALFSNTKRFIIKLSNNG